MKKLIVILAIVMVASPVMAAVTVSCAQVGTTNSFTVSYGGASATDPNSAVRGFALDISVSNGTISGVTCSNSSYYIYPGSIQISGGSVQSYGSCICSSTYPGTNPGLGTSAVTVEMGSLYTGTTKPATSGTLMTVSTTSTLPATVTIAANSARGGVVMENPNFALSGTLSTCILAGGDCFPSAYTTYTDWKSAGKPNCWCGTNGTAPIWKFQCYGDGDNTTETLSKYRVYTNDYWKLMSNWKKKITDATWDRCSDFDHKSETLSKYRVYTNDYWRMMSNWKKKDSQFPGSGNCPTAE